MNTLHTLRRLSLSVVSLSLILAAVPVSAAVIYGGADGTVSSTGVNASVDADMHMSPGDMQQMSSSSSDHDGQAPARTLKIDARANAELDRRVAALTALDARLQEATKISDSDKASINTGIQVQITALNGLKAKIAGDTDAATATADKKTITTSYRIFALIIPQGHIIAAADRISTIVTAFESLSAKLQAQITVASDAGKNVTTLQASLTDLNAKVADATIQANAATGRVTPLMPDNGDKTVAKANHDTLVAARADIKVGMQDLTAARKDAAAIIKALAGFHLNDTHATTTASTTVSQ